MSNFILRLSVVEKNPDGKEKTTQTKTLAFQPNVRNNSQNTALAHFNSDIVAEQLWRHHHSAAGEAEDHD